MFDYYHHFVDKGNHPDENDILKLERNIEKQCILDNKDELVTYMKENAPKPIGVRIIVDDRVVVHELDPSFDQQADQWLTRKEKVVNETGHSSYYVFLHNIQTGEYDHMIYDETYAICGGGFPLYENDKLYGTIAVTGCRPHEDHQLVIDALHHLGLL